MTLTVDAQAAVHLINEWEKRTPGKRARRSVTEEANSKDQSSINASAAKRLKLCRELVNIDNSVTVIVVGL